MCEKYNTRNADGSLHTWDLGSLKLDRLPDSICSLKLSGELKLGSNNLTSLPANFGCITLGGDLQLWGNPVVAAGGVPASFPNVRGVIIVNEEDCEEDDY